MRSTVCAAAILAAACLISIRSRYEPDLWWHLAQGREIAAGHLVHTNVFSAAYAAYPQAYTSWLFDLGAYELWTRGGALAIQAAQALLIAAALAAIALACRLRASLAATMAVVAFGWLILDPRALPRPHLFSFLGIAVCTYLIERARQARSWRPLAWAPLAIAIWSNLHLECVFGVAMIGLFGAAEWLRPRDLTRRDAAMVLTIAVASLAATAANPYGLGLLRYTYENAFVPQIIRIAELQPPYLPNYRGFYAWLFLVVVLMTVRRRQAALIDLVFVILFGVIGLRYLRLTPLVFLASAPVAARCLDDLRAFGLDRRVIAAAAVLAAAFLPRVPVPGMIREVQAGGDALEPPSLFSARAMRFAHDHGLRGPAFTSINLGGYVAWKLYPETRIFLDTRLQAYPPEFFRAVRDASADPQAWDALTANVDWAILSVPRVNEWSGAGRFPPDTWGTAYRDAAIEILVRRRGPFGALAGL